MRLAITGGGTGGHVFPALEVARLARERGHELFYLGSLRGQEGAICARENIRFQGFPTAPLYSIKTLRGIRAAFKILSATRGAKAALKAWEPDALFSTGGYSAAPVVNAARSLKIPYVLLEANSVPGRSNAMFARQAFAVATVFRGTERHLPGAEVVRTGMPIRQALREAAKLRKESLAPTVLVTGGSQGSEFLNELIPKAAGALDRLDVQWLHVAGKANASLVELAVNDLGLTNYRVAAFLEADEMASAYASATLIVSRSGGSLAEVALFQLPSVLIPLPSSAGNHQLYNAQEFVEMGAATLRIQASASPQQLAADIAAWLDHPAKRVEAAKALKSFDAPEATENILKMLERAAS